MCDDQDGVFAPQFPDQFLDGLQHVGAFIAHVGGIHPTVLGRDLGEAMGGAAIGVTLGWLPTFGRGEVVQLGFWSTGLLTAAGLMFLFLSHLSFMGAIVCFIAAAAVVYRRPLFERVMIGSRVVRKALGK